MKKRIRSEKVSEEQQEQIRRLGVIMDQARQNKEETEKKAKEGYTEMKHRFPEFWKAFDVKTEEEDLRHFDL